MAINGRATRAVLAIGAAGMLAAGVAACGGDDSGSSSSGGGGGSGSKDEQVKVGLITKTDTNPFFVKMKEGADAAKKNNVKLITAAGKFDGDNAGQVTAIENMVAPGVKGILITPSDSKAIVPAIKKARDKGVLVIALDTPTEPESAVDALFATDNLKAGELIGQYAKAAGRRQDREDRHPRPRAGRLRRRPAARRLPEGLRHHEATRRSSAPRTPAATRPRARPRWRTACRRTRTSTSSTPSTSRRASAAPTRSRRRQGPEGRPHRLRRRRLHAISAASRTARSPRPRSSTR